MKKYLIVFAALLMTYFAQAQFPGGGGGGNNKENRGSQGGWGPPGMNNQNQKQQTKGFAKISGIILDSTSNKGVEFANVALYNKATNKLIDGTIADEKGKFTLEGLGDGLYKIQVTFLGYGSSIVDDIKIVKERNVSLPIIKLSEGANTLSEVTVTGQKALIEEKVDRLVYNAEKDQLAKGGDAADVLRKVPLLQVDLEGNVTVRGSSQIKVLINNKPSTIMASSVADALKQIPADMIKTVEVITSPSAKYDAEGSAGIINIITKKDKLQGYNMNMDIGAGLRGSNLGMNGTFRSGKLGVTMGGHGRAFYNKAENSLTQNTLINGINQTTNQFSPNAKDNGLWGQYNIGMDYDIDKTQTITGNVRFGVRDFNRDQRQTTILNSNLKTLTTLKDINSQDQSRNVDVNFDYLKTFSSQREWSIATQYSRNNLTNNFNSDSLNTGTPYNVLNRLKNINNNLNQEVTIQSDYQTPIGASALFEIGGKGIFRKVNSDYQYLSAKDAIADYVQDILKPTGALNYGQNVVGTYSSLTYSTPNKITFKGGARYEYTTIDATQNNKTITIPSYGTLVPSINASKTLKNNATVKLGYNKRIQRPGLQQLNPNYNAVNSQSITVGNPNLKPELTDNVELSLSKMMGKTYLNASIFGRFTDNAINQVRRPLDSLGGSGAILTTYENVGHQRSYGSNIFTNIYLTNTWSINGGFDLFYTFLEGQVTGADRKTTTTAKNQGFNIGGRLMSQLSLKNGWSFQAFSYMRGAQVQLQGKQGGHGMYSMGVNKDFNNKKGSIGMSVENFAQKGWTMRSELTSPQFSQVTSNLLYNRNIKVNLKYKFGKMTFVDSKKKTRGVSNDDVKGGDGGGGEQPQQARPQGGGAPQGGQGRPQGGTPPANVPPNKGGNDLKQQGGTPSMEGQPKKEGGWQGGQGGRPLGETPPANREGQPKKEGEGDKKWQGGQGRPQGETPPANREGQPKKEGEGEKKQANPPVKEGEIKN
jgi:outer membrane receptor protein involved in Fe transport